MNIEGLPKKKGRSLKEIKKKVYIEKSEPMAIWIIIMNK